MASMRYPIKAVSRLTSISVDTLRAWERRHQVVAPERDERGRLYSESDIERLRLLREASERGHAIGRVAALTTDELRGLLSRVPDSLAAPAPPPATPVELAPLVAAVDRFDAPSLRRELSRIAAVLPARTFAREVAIPFLVEIGEGWHAGRFGVAQEHLATAEVRSLVGGLSRLVAAPEGAPRLVLATPAGESHEIGTLVAALIAAGAGFGAFYLGADLPPLEIVAAARRVAARAVVLGYTGAGAAAGALDALLVVAHRLPADVACWVGGPGAEVARAALSHTSARIVADLDDFERALVELGGR